MNINYRDMTPEQQRQTDFARQETLRKLKGDAESTMEWYDSCNPETRAKLRKSRLLG